MYFLQVFIILTGLTSCRNNQYRVRISSIEADVNIKRLEKDLFLPNPEEIAGVIPRLKEEYGDFLQLFSYVINTGSIDDPSFPEYLTRFCTDRLNNEVFEMTMDIYPDLAEVERDLARAFRHYLYYYPGRKLPSVYTCITGFNSSIIIGDTILGISLDKYLGADCEFYPRLEIYQYMASKMTPDNLVPDCIYAWGASEWEYESMNYPVDNVMTRILHEGKLKYFQRCMLPETSDELLFGFSPEQMKFCRNNESQMWHYLIENDLMFRTDRLTIRKLIGDAPFTSYFTGESPGRAAVWTGFRIVESYMAKNNSITLEQLMNNLDLQDVLAKSRYDP